MGDLIDIHGEDFIHRDVRVFTIHHLTDEIGYIIDQEREKVDRDKQGHRGKDGFEKVLQDVAVYDGELIWTQDVWFFQRLALKGILLTYGTFIHIGNLDDNSNEHK